MLLLLYANVELKILRAFTWAVASVVVGDVVVGSVDTDISLVRCDDNEEGIVETPDW